MGTVMDYLRDAFKHLVLIVVAIALVYLGKSFSCTKIDGGFTCMRPDIEGGEMVFIDRRPARSGKFRVGDMVCFAHPSGRKVSTRAGHVAGLAGETFEARDGALFVDGKRCGSKQVASLSRYHVPAILVPSGYVLVTFNEPPSRKLSFAQHLVPISSIKGRIVK